VRVGTIFRAQRAYATGPRPLKLIVRRTMHPWARAALFFAAGLWAAVVVFGAVAIYGFDYYEGEWGRGPSLQVHIWIATLGALAALVPAALGFRLGGRKGDVPGRLLSFISGVAMTLLFLLIGFIFPGRLTGSVVLTIAVVLIAFCLSYLLCIFRYRSNASPSNKRLERP
jgi:hypothetical protein